MIHLSSNKINRLSLNSFIYASDLVQYTLMGKHSGEINLSRSILEAHGSDSLSYFALHKKKKFFFSSTGKSFLAYSLVKKIIVVSGNPIGPSEEIPQLLREFSYFVKGTNLKCCFVGVTKEILPLFHRNSLKSINIGYEAFITLQQFKKAFLSKRVRRAETHNLKLGITSKMYKRSRLPSHYLDQLNAVSKEWLANKGVKEKGYSMTLGRLPEAQDGDYEIVLALQNNIVLGYITFAPIYAINGLSLDSMRRRTNVPNGLTEFLLLQAFEHYKRKKIETISLNFATFYPMNKSKNPNMLSSLQSLLYKGLSRWYGTHNLYAFSNKFLPQWRNRYLVIEKRRFLPQYLFALAKVEL